MICQGDCREVLRTLEPESVQTCVTSPPYWGLRDYGVADQLGLEPTPEAYVANLVAVFREVRRVLRDDGTLWLNLGDSYAGSRAGEQGVGGQMADRSVAAVRCRVRSETRVAYDLKAKDLAGIPWRVAFALQADGWYLRSDIIWAKPNPMPESVTDRPTKAHEYVFLLSKSATYFYDADAIAEQSVIGLGAVRRMGAVKPDGTGRADIGRHSVNDGSRNARSVWTIPTRPYAEAHFATFPEELARRCILAGSKPGDTVLDPFNGAGTTGLVAQENLREYVGIELNPEYVAIAERRLAQNVLPLGAA